MIYNYQLHEDGEMLEIFLTDGVGTHAYEIPWQLVESLAYYWIAKIFNRKRFFLRKKDKDGGHCEIAASVDKIVIDRAMCGRADGNALQMDMVYTVTPSLCEEGTFKKERRAVLPFVARFIKAGEIES